MTTPCAYAEDYDRDDEGSRRFTKPYTVTVGSYCRPVRKRMPGAAQRNPKLIPNNVWFHWTHLLQVNYL